MVSPHTANDPLAGPQAIEEMLAEKNPAGRFCHGEPDHRRYLPGDASDPAQLFDANLEPFKRVMLSTTPAWRSPRSPRSIRASSPISMGTETVASR
jgi:hypothetical protein